MDSLPLSTGDSGVTFCEPIRDEEGWLGSFSVRIDETGLRAEARVENSGVIQAPEVFFSELAQSWRGWTGEKTWRSLEAELALVATTDSCGHVTLEIRLRPDAGPGAWRVISYAYFEAGQLASLACRAAQFFGRRLS